MKLGFLSFVYHPECANTLYKDTISNTRCLQCPTNSAINAKRTACTCNEGFFRSSDVADCKGNENYKNFGKSFTEIIQHWMGEGEYFVESSKCNERVIIMVEKMPFRVNVSTTFVVYFTCPFIFYLRINAF